MELWFRNLEIHATLGKISKKLDKLQKELKHEKNKPVRKEKDKEIRKRRAEIAAVRRQLSDAGGCISFMRDQCNRVNDLEAYAR